MPKTGNGKPQGRSGPTEEMKRKFREALDKKHAHGGREVSDTHDHGKVDHAQDAATSATQQMFRRKSGG
jgi:hypothetical protein